MPDGSVANCYAEDVAGRVASSAYPNGFEHHYWNPNILGKPKSAQDHAKIFVGSMADVFGHWVPEDQIQQVLDVMWETPQHAYQLLTKNPKRTLDFKMPSNAWVGASSPPDFMWNKPLNQVQKERMLHTSLRSLAKVDVPIRWMSFEPLSWDVTPIVAQYPGVLQWAVIGAASNGRKKYPANVRHVRDLVQVLEDQGVPIFYKGNIKSTLPKGSKWREAFPLGYQRNPDEWPEGYEWDTVPLLQRLYPMVLVHQHNNTTEGKIKSPFYVWQTDTLVSVIDRWFSDRYPGYLPQLYSDLDLFKEGTL